MRFSISEIEVVNIFKLRGQQAYHAGHMDMMDNMYSCIFMKRIFYLYKISIKSPISELEADMLLTQ